MRFTVGYDATAAVRQHAGIGRYARELLRALVEQDDGVRYRIFYSGGAADNSGLPSLPAGVRVRSLPVTDRISNALWHRARIPLPVQTVLGRVSLFHSPDFAAPPALGRPRIITVHDLAFERHPECAFPTLRAYLQRVVPRQARAAAHIIAVSETTKKDLVELYDIPERRVTVIHEAVAPVMLQLPQSYVARTILAQLGIRDPYILAVGTLEPRKNYVRLLDAYASLIQKGVRHKLVIAGRPGWLYEPIFDRIRRLGLQDKVILIRPSDEHLGALYSAAEAFVYPSLYEGFGIPALEALAAGVPSAVTCTSSLPEVVGEAAVLFDPTQSSAIADALEQVLLDKPLRQSLHNAGPERAAQFSWARAAEETTAVYRSVAGG